MLILYFYLASFSKNYYFVLMKSKESRIIKRKSLFNKINWAVFLSILALLLGVINFFYNKQYRIEDIEFKRIESKSIIKIDTIIQGITNVGVKSEFLPKFEIGEVSTTLYMHVTNNSNKTT